MFNYASRLHFSTCVWDCRVHVGRTRRNFKLLFAKYEAHWLKNSTRNLKTHIVHSSKQSLLWKRKLPELTVNTGQIARSTGRASVPKSMDVKQSSTQLNRPSQVSESRCCNSCTYRSGAKKMTMIKRQKQEYQWQSDASKTEKVHFEKEVSPSNWRTVQSSKAKRVCTFNLFTIFFFNKISF